MVINADSLTSEQKKVIQAIGCYEEENPDRAGMPPKDLEDKAKLEFAQLKAPLEKLMEDGFIEAVDLSERRPEHRIRRSLPQEVDEEAVKPAFESNYRFRLTQEGLKLYEQLAKAPRGKWRIKAWVKNHPHSYGLIGCIIFLMLFFVLGLVKAQWRNWCWGTAGVALLVLILSLLGGRSSR